MKRQSKLAREKAKKLATDYVKSMETGETLKEIGLKNGFKDSPHISTAVQDSLKRPIVLQEIQKKILKKEQLQEIQSSLVEKLNDAVKDNVTVENVPLINQLGINIERNAKLNGDLIEKMQVLNVNVTAEYSDIFKKAMSDTSDAVGEG